MQKTLIAVVVIALIAFGIYFITNNSSKDVEKVDNAKMEALTQAEQKEKAEKEEAEKKKNAPEVVIGKSVEKRDITAYRFGTGETELLFVGGIHGGYSWNTALVAFEFMKYLKENPNVVPSDLKVTIIPVLNPDGLNKAAGTSEVFESGDVTKSATILAESRFNANKVDINRNFDCDWQASGVWQNKTVSGGSSVFSEPEALAIKNYVAENKPIAVVAWYSSAGGVYASSCSDEVAADTLALTNLYAKASGYKAYEDFNAYKLTGDMVNWFAKNNVPAISVLLSNHTDTEWSKNKAGIEALLKFYSK